MDVENNCGLQLDLFASEKECDRTPNRTVWTNPRLTQLYATYNSAYFQRKLPQFDVFIADLNPAALWDGICHGRCDFKKRRILIAVQFLPDDFEVTSTMLHEMAHISRLTVGGDGSHGPDWQAEIRRLWRAGAPVYEDGWGTDRMSGWDVRYDNPEDDPMGWDEHDPRWFAELQPDEISEDGEWSGLLVSNLREARPGERLKRTDSLRSQREQVQGSKVLGTLRPNSPETASTR